MKLFVCKNDLIMLKIYLQRGVPFLCKKVESVYQEIQNVLLLVALQYS